MKTEFARIDTFPRGSLRLAADTDRSLSARNVRFGSCVTSFAGPHGKRNCSRDEGGPFRFGNQVLIPSHRKLLSSKAMVVSVAEKSGHDPGRHG